MVHAHARVRRGAIALVAAFLGLFLTAGPAAAAPLVWVGVANSGPDPVLVTVIQGPGVNVNIKTGCGTSPPQGATFAVCLPGPGVLAFAVSLPSAGD